MRPPSPYTRAGGDDEIRQACEKAGYLLDMGKSCIRFRRLVELPLPELGREIAATGVDEFIRRYEAARRR